MLVRRELTKLEGEFPELRIEKVDILTNPSRALRQRVKMIPTLRFGDSKLSGIFLSSSKIRQFVRQAVRPVNEG
ncbi:MAG: hypothetical protein D3924_00905 [Candidatus Electrothrix sp. AR4]|nr:hypothetical protein [Candidatus Electrothrix sp. AR4]